MSLKERSCEASLTEPSENCQPAEDEEQSDEVLSGIYYKIMILITLFTLINLYDNGDYYNG